MAAQKGKPKKTKAPKKKAERSPLETRFTRDIASYPIPQPVEEYAFCPDRKWRADFAWPNPAIKLLVEIEGGIHNHGRHTRAAGYEADCEKYKWAALHGWTVLRYAGRLLPGAAREVADFVASKIKA